MGVAGDEAQVLAGFEGRVGFDARADGCFEFAEGALELIAFERGDLRFEARDVVVDLHLQFARDRALDDRDAMQERVEIFDRRQAVGRARGFGRPAGAGARAARGFDRR